MGSVTCAHEQALARMCPASTRPEGAGRTLVMGHVCLSGCRHDLGWDCVDRHRCPGEVVGTLAKGITLLLATPITYFPFTALPPEK